MKALKYKIEVSGSGLEFIHGFSGDIEEMHIPDLHLFINEKAIFVEEDKEGEERRIQDAKNLVELQLPPTLEVVAKALVKSIESKEEQESTLLRYLLGEIQEKEKQDIFRYPDSPLYYGILAEKWSHEYARNALINFIEEKGLTQVAIDWVEENQGWEDRS